MRAIVKRRVLDGVIQGAAISALLFAGAGWWSYIVLPISLWNYYDGKTRGNLK